MTAIEYVPTGSSAGSTAGAPPAFIAAQIVFFDSTFVRLIIAAVSGDAPFVPRSVSLAFVGSRIRSRCFGVPSLHARCVGVGSLVPESVNSSS